MNCNLNYDVANSKYKKAFPKISHRSKMVKVRKNSSEHKNVNGKKYCFKKITIVSRADTFIS